jgi:hypothetical protein
LLVRGKIEVLKAARKNVGAAIQEMEDEAPARFSISYHFVEGALFRIRDREEGWR